MRNVLVVPVYNPTDKFLDVVKKNLRGFSRVIVVDDGSYKNIELFEKLPKKYVVIHHHENMGKGAAIKTAVKNADSHFKKITGYITVDADGQHKKADIKKIDKKLKNDNFILGTRDFKNKNMPIRSRFGNFMTSIFFRMATGCKIKDTQTGLRGIPAKYKSKVLKTEGKRYDFEMNFLMDLAREGETIEQVPIETVYEKGNKSSRFRPIIDSILVYRRFIMFSLSSIFSSLVDLAIFAIFTTFAMDPLKATVAARFFSGAVNFGINKKSVFKYAGKPALPKYALLFVTKMIISGVVVKSLENVFVEIPLVFIKAGVDFILFFVGFAIQNRFIFVHKKANVV